MHLRLAVQGVDQLTVQKTGKVMQYAFGMEAAPASLRQIVKVPLNGAVVKPGEVVTINVTEVGESRGALWVRGGFVASK